MGEDLSEWRLGGGGLVTWVGMKHEWEVKKQPEGAVTPQTAPFRGCGVGNDCVGLQGQRMDFYFERREEVSIFIQMNMWIRSFSWIVLSSFCPLDFPSNLASLWMSLQFSFILQKKNKQTMSWHHSASLSVFPPYSILLPIISSAFCTVPVPR